MKKQMQKQQILMMKTKDSFQVPRSESGSRNWCDESADASSTNHEVENLWLGFHSHLVVAPADDAHRPEIAQTQAPTQHLAADNIHAQTATLRVC